MIAKSFYHMPLLSWNPTPDPTPKTSPTSTIDIASFKTRAMGSRPLSLHIPSGTFPSARPTLDEVLSNRAPFPFTLGAFMAYLSQNHCLETLEFTMEAKRYQESYRSVARMLGQSVVTGDSPQTQQLIILWRRLLTAYIVPGAPREINLSSEVRDALLANSHAANPPRPGVLDAAVRIMHDLMEESIFIHFLNSQSFGPQMSSSMENPYIEDRPHRLRRTESRSKRISPSGSRDETTMFNRMSGSARVAALAGSHFSEYSSSGDSGSPVLTDDSGSLASRTPSRGDPMTPPTTPPGSELSYSPRSRADNTWKKMGAKLGFNKKRPNSTSRDGRWEE